jgi:hypothetical protein
MMEAIYSSETYVVALGALHHIPEDGIPFESVVHKMWDCQKSIGLQGL